MSGFFKKHRRKNLAAAPFPPAWRQILHQRFPLYGRLSEADRRELESHIQVFLAEKQFEGCGGLAITDDIRVTIAAQACLLLLHRPTDYYGRLRSILVYPSTYFAPSEQSAHAGVIQEEQDARLGESWEQGAVVLAWDSVRGGLHVRDQKRWIRASGGQQGAKPFQGCDMRSSGCNHGAASSVNDGHTLQPVFVFSQLGKNCAEIVGQYIQVVSSVAEIIQSQTCGFDFEVNAFGVYVGKGEDFRCSLFVELRLHAVHGVEKNTGSDEERGDDRRE